MNLLFIPAEWNHPVWWPLMYLPHTLTFTMSLWDVATGCSHCLSNMYEPVGLLLTPVGRTGREISDVYNMFTNMYHLPLCPSSHCMSTLNPPGYPCP